MNKKDDKMMPKHDEMGQNKGSQNTGKGHHDEMGHMKKDHKK